MALTFRAYNAYDSAGSHTATVTKPTGTADGDIMFALVSNINTGDAPTPPNGWTQIASGNSGFFRLYYKIASSEGASYVWEFGGAGSYQIRVTVASYYGDFNSITDTILVYSNTDYGTSNTTVRASSMNVTTSNSPLLFFGLVWNSSASTFTKPSAPTTDWVEDIDAGNTNSDFYHTFCHMIWTSSGATGNMDATSSTTNTNKHAFAVALRTTFDYTYTQTDTIALSEVNTSPIGVNASQIDTIELSDSNTNEKKIWSNEEKTFVSWTNEDKSI